MLGEEGGAGEGATTRFTNVTLDCGVRLLVGAQVGPVSQVNQF